MFLDEFKQALGRVVAEYENKERDAFRALEIVTYCLREFADRWDNLHGPLKQMASVIDQWDGSNTDDSTDVMNRICDLYRVWLSDK